MRNLFLIISSSIALTSFCSAQQLRKLYETSDAVVAGHVIRSWDGEIGADWRFDTPNTRTDLRIRLVSFRVTRWLKGSGPGEIVIALPREESSEGDAPERARYEISENSIGLWFLQTPQSTADFRYEMYRSWNGSDYMWTAPGAAYAPVDRTNPASYLRLTTGMAGTFSNPLVQLADLMARNSAVDPGRKSAFVSWIEDLTPLEVKAVGYGRDIEGTELQHFRTWLDADLPTHFPSVSVENRLVQAAIRLFWGDASAEATFVTLYENNPGRLLGRFPPISPESAVRLLDKLPIDQARMAFRELRTRNQDRLRITLAGLARFDESHPLDAAILESLSQLWNRPDLNPIENGTVATNLAERKRRARELAG
ncbi:MAG: hypothetical protein M3R13_09635 [Armatimonadota bacterium]|nr:hypothetical protein [Armatimonadota bacterium]